MPPVIAHPQGAPANRQGVHLPHGFANKRRALGQAGGYGYRHHALPYYFFPAVEVFFAALLCALAVKLPFATEPPFCFACAL